MIELDYIRKVEVLRVVDGDTLEVRIDLGFHTYIVDRLRLEGVDTPEVYGTKHANPEEYRRGKMASAFTEAWVDSYDEIFIQSKKTGKYGRYIATVFGQSFGSDEVSNLNLSLATWMAEMESSGWTP